MKIQYKRIPKPLRFIISLLRKLIIAAAFPIWFPAMIVIWFVLRCAIGLFDFVLGVWEKA